MHHSFLPRGEKENRGLKEGGKVEEKEGKGREGRRGHFEVIKHMFNSDLSHKANKPKIFLINIFILECYSFPLFLDECI